MAGLIDALENASARELVVWYLQKWVLHPYLWAGDDFLGVDCSGLMVEVLTAVGKLPAGTDLTADGLWQRFKGFEIVPPDPRRAGCLAFWFSQGRAFHVEMLITPQAAIGASGGGPPRTTVADVVESLPLLKALIKPGDNAQTNLFYWAIEKIILFREADRRNAFIKMHKLHGDYRLCDPFLLD